MTSVEAPIYPFSAVIGHDRLRLALMLCAVRPDIGGVLIRGEKGTAKSTAVRGLAQVLSAAFRAAGDQGGQLVELPIGATEDRVVGSLDLQKVLRDGEQAFSPGLLARAHRGVLYVDEVNLLHDHLVDVLLDAAAMGRVHIERDGVSHSHDARFVLIGTMNPEEGELRPQLLDRFGLTVDVQASRDVDVRAEVIRARLAYEADPAGFADRYADQDAELADRIARARALVADVVLPDKELRRIAALCAAFDVDGMRADLVVARTAVAHAAWRGATSVDEDDIRVAAELALPHRRRRDPFDDPGLDPGRLDEAMQQAGDSADGAAGPDPEPEPDPPGGGMPETPDSDVPKLRATGRPKPKSRLKRRRSRAIRPRRPAKALRRRCPSPPGRSWCRGWVRVLPAGARGRGTAPAPSSRRLRTHTPVTGCTCSQRFSQQRAGSGGPARCVRPPTTSAVRSGRGARPTW